MENVLGPFQSAQMDTFLSNVMLQMDVKSPPPTLTVVQKLFLSLAPLFASLQSRIWRLPTVLW
jgi:hypothetical protein